MLTSELILLENLTKDLIPFFLNQFPAKFDIIAVRWEGRGGGCRLETFHYHASQIKTDSFDKSVKTRWFCTGGERVGQSGAKYGREQEILNLMENQCTSRLREIEGGRVSNKK